MKIDQNLHRMNVIEKYNKLMKVEKIFPNLCGSFAEKGYCLHPHSCTKNHLTSCGNLVNPKTHRYIRRYEGPYCVQYEDGDCKCGAKCLFPHCDTTKKGIITNAPKKHFSDEDCQLIIYESQKVRKPYYCNSKLTRMIDFSGQIPTSKSSKYKSGARKR